MAAVEPPPLPEAERERERRAALGLARTWEERPMFALDADVTVYWPAVRPCWEEVGQQ